MMPRVSEMQVLVGERRLLRARENGRGLLYPEDYRDRVAAIRAKAKVGAPARQGRWLVSSAVNLDI